METSKTFRKRNAILHCLRSTTSHPSAEALYQLLQKEHPDPRQLPIHHRFQLRPHRPGPGRDPAAHHLGSAAQYLYPGDQYEEYDESAVGA